MHCAANSGWWSAAARNKGTGTIKWYPRNASEMGVSIRRLSARTARTASRCNENNLLYSKRASGVQGVPIRAVKTEIWPRVCKTWSMREVRMKIQVYWEEGNANGFNR
jgi:hypothetical protein